MPPALLQLLWSSTASSSLPLPITNIQFRVSISAGIHWLLLLLRLLVECWRPLIIPMCIINKLCLQIVINKSAVALDRLIEWSFTASPPEWSQFSSGITKIGLFFISSHRAYGQSGREHDLNMASGIHPTLVGGLSRKEIFPNVTTSLIKGTSINAYWRSWWVQRDRSFCKSGMGP